MDGWNIFVSFWGPAYFQGFLLLVSGSVTVDDDLILFSWWLNQPILKIVKIGSFPQG